MDNNNTNNTAERITSDTPDQSELNTPSQQQSPFGQEPAPEQPAGQDQVQPETPAQPDPNTQQDQQTPPPPPAAPVQPVEPTQPVAQQPQQQPPAFNGLNTSQTVQQPQQGAFIPKTMNVANLQGGSTAVKEDMEQKAHFMRDVLHAQRKVPIMIPLAFGERPGTMHPFGINGYFMYVQKGVMVNVPEQIAHMAIESFNLDYANGADIDLSKNEDKQRALA